MRDKPTAIDMIYGPNGPTLYVSRVNSYSRIPNPTRASLARVRQWLEANEWKSASSISDDMFCYRPGTPDSSEYCKCNNPLTNEDEQRTGVCRECR